MIMMGKVRFLFNFGNSFSIIFRLFVDLLIIINFIGMLFFCFFLDFFFVNYGIFGVDY